MRSSMIGTGVAETNIDIVGPSFRKAISACSNTCDRDGVRNMASASSIARMNFPPGTLRR